MKSDTKRQASLLELFRFVFFMLSLMLAVIYVAGSEEIKVSEEMQVTVQGIGRTTQAKFLKVDGGSYSLMADFSDETRDFYYRVKKGDMVIIRVSQYNAIAYLHAAGKTYYDVDDYIAGRHAWSRTARNSGVGFFLMFIVCYLMGRRRKPK